MYIDALYSAKDSIVKVVERVNGKRVFKEIPANYTFYVSDPRGAYKTMYGDPVKKYVCKNHAEYQKQKKANEHKTLWESDLSPLSRCLEEVYSNGDVPEAHVAFFDIETDFDRELGYSSPEEAFNPIISVAIYLQWLGKMVCFAVPPRGVTRDEAEQIAKEVGDTIICDDESQMLEMFLAVIDDADILSGWNSDLYDIPYLINRIKRLHGNNAARQMCMWNLLPRKKMIERFGKEQMTYDLTGRIHLDYLELYKKYNYDERHSYALNAIAEIELGEKKVDYDGTLDELYNNDFKKFIEYNIQDTLLLDKLDVKLQFMDLANTIAHSNRATFQQTMGTVAQTDQAIIIEAHSQGLVVHNKRDSDPDAMRAAGGWVQEPIKGLHKDVGSTDLNSLYPSAIRAWNMSNETIVGQVRTTTTNKAIIDHIESAKKNTFAGWWNDRFTTLEMQYVLDQDSEQLLWLDMEDGSSYELTGADIHELVFEKMTNWCISANGTIFRMDKAGIIPSLLTRWYAERKQMQALDKSYGAVKLTEGIDSPDGWFTKHDIEDVNRADPYDVDTAFSRKKLEEYIAKDDKESFKEYVNLHGLQVVDGKVVTRDATLNNEYKNYWNKRQLVKKINLNSLYGGLLNDHSRFYDQRIGQSTTLSGRCITRHMAAEVNRIITGKYDHCGETIIYGDTDSVYFSAYKYLKPMIDSGEIIWDKDTVTMFYDAVAEKMNTTFPSFALDTFNVPHSYSNGVLAAGREIVASTALYIVKKRYAALVYDDEGERKDVNGKPGKLKAMGLDLRRSDTPVRVQKFLSDILMAVLLEHEEEEVIESIRKFKEDFDALNPWEKGSPKSVNNLTKYREKIEEYERLLSKYAKKPENVRIPGHVQASLNWNELREKNHDYHVGSIVDGQKIIVCKLKETQSNSYTSIAYPVDEAHLPEWFTELPFDEDGMMKSVVDKKVENLLKTLNWDLSRTSKQSALNESLFDFNNM